MSIHQRKIKVPPSSDKTTGAVVQAHGSEAAPFIYFDGAIAYGTIGNIVQIELGANVVVPITNNGKYDVRTRQVVVGHLRGTHAAFAQLAEAIEKALMMTGPLDRNALPPEEPKKAEPKKEKENVQPV